MGQSGIVNAIWVQKWTLTSTVTQPSNIIIYSVHCNSDIYAIVSVNSTPGANVKDSSQSRAEKTWQKPGQLAKKRKWETALKTHLVAGGDQNTWNEYLKSEILKKWGKSKGDGSKDSLLWGQDQEAHKWTVNVHLWIYFGHPLLTWVFFIVSFWKQ